MIEYGEVFLNDMFSLLGVIGFLPLVENLLYMFEVAPVDGDLGDGDKLLPSLLRCLNLC